MSSNKSESLDLSGLERFTKLENQEFKLTKIGSKRENSMVGVGQFEEGDFYLGEFPVTEKYPNPQAYAEIVGRGFHYMRTSPIVKITEQTDTSTTFETEGGIYKLEKV